MKKVMLEDENITLGHFLKWQGVIQTGGEAKHYLLNANIMVNDELETRRGRKLHVGDRIEVPGVEVFYLISKE
ncbi:S4 domain-containing protein YaaA [Rubeoparvulum massiliense]|uniref:S4 domain-containing protein YaaA n=1 Tax=Rubeoparvulum massiliense TaxID=1631346 RepID=UPI00065DC13F|nr:S4 domain-containing protein YaaA [Rubeoparvulum massiliense]